MFAVRKLIAILIMAAAFALPVVCSAGFHVFDRVALLPFTNQSASRSVSLGEASLKHLENQVFTDLTNAGFKMLDRGNIAKILNEMELSHSALADPSTAARIGKLTGAQYIIIGTASASRGSETTAHFSLRMIEVETARVTLAGLGRGKADNLDDALEKAGTDALEGKRGMLTLLHGGKRK